MSHNEAAEETGWARFRCFAFVYLTGVYLLGSGDVHFGLHLVLWSIDRVICRRCAGNTVRRIAPFAFSCFFLFSQEFCQVLR